MVVLDSNEKVQAVCRLREHIRWQRLRADGKVMPLQAKRGRPGTNGHNQYDARIIRFVDMDRVLRVFGAPEYGWLVRHVVDGDSVPVIAQDADMPLRLVEDSIRASITILTDRMRDRNML